MKVANPYPQLLEGEEAEAKVSDERHRVWEEATDAYIRELKEHGFPVVMKEGTIIIHCDDTSTANSLILNLEDFPELKE